MKRSIKFITICLIASLAFMSCSTMKSSRNIVDGSEFVPCTDRSCALCGGTGSYECPNCHGEGGSTCTSCNGSGTQVCDGDLAMDMLGYTCKGGYAFATNLELYEDLMDSEGYILEDSYDENGNAVKVRSLCPHCDGSCEEDCSECDGTGTITCSTCSGSGSLACGETIYFSTCLGCGTRLEAGAQSCSNCGLSATIFTCKDCGAVFNEGADICPECGAGA